MLKLLATIFCLIPLFSVAAPTLLVDAVPVGASFFNYATVEVPIPDLSKANAAEVEAGLASSISRVIPFAEQNSVTHICLLSAAGNDPRSFAIAAANAELRLRTRNAHFVIVLYREGFDTPSRLSYSIEKPDRNRQITSLSIKKIAVPQGWSTAAWIYFNLPRVQAEALKAGATQLFLEAKGKGVKTPVIIPGLNEPLMVFDEDTSIEFAWYATEDQGAGMANP